MKCLVVVEKLMIVTAAGTVLYLSAQFDWRLDESVRRYDKTFKRSQPAVPSSKNIAEMGFNEFNRQRLVKHYV